MDNGKNKKALIAVLAAIIMVCIVVGALLTTLIGTKLFAKKEETQPHDTETTSDAYVDGDEFNEEEMTAGGITDLLDQRLFGPDMVDKRLDITDEEINTLADFINEKMGIDEMRLDVGTQTIIESQIIRAYYGVIGTYDLYFPQPPCYIPDYDSVPDQYKKYYMSEYKADPLGKFDCYTIIPEDEIIWMCENIYNRDYEQPTYESDLSYFYKGNYYIDIGDGSAPNPVVTLYSCNKEDSTGIYNLIFELRNDDAAESVYFYIKMDVRMIDGKRCMTFYEMYETYLP